MNPIFTTTILHIHNYFVFVTRFIICLWRKNFTFFTVNFSRAGSDKVEGINFISNI